MSNEQEEGEGSSSQARLSDTGKQENLAQPTQEEAAKSPVVFERLTLDNLVSLRHGTKTGRYRVLTRILCGWITAGESATQALVHPSSKRLEPPRPV